MSINSEFASILRFFHGRRVTVRSVAHFLTPYSTEYPGDQILTGHSVPIMQKQKRTPDLQKTKSENETKTETK